ncbi:WSC-domain-containing protein [Teratosphaeria destructans]|uniref:WSC-domain-containing protein n=1 Tax=Teratosphaeria destructans TaxID=418781 RepID=A0A9W7STE8_9PEZI|nr:WSC-domain-containing protein [Teratosphaeria destructans]
MTTTLNVTQTLPQATTTFGVTSTLPQATTTLNITSTLPQATTTLSVTSTLPQATTTLNITSTLPQATTTLNITSTLPQPTTTLNVTSTLPQATTTLNITSTLPQATTTLSVTSTLPQPTTTLSVTSTLPQPTTTLNVTSTLPQPTTTLNVTSTLPQPTTTLNVTSTLPQATTTRNVTSTLYVTYTSLYPVTYTTITTANGTTITATYFSNITTTAISTLVTTKNIQATATTTALETCLSTPTVTPISSFGTNGSSGSVGNYLGCYNSSSTYILTGTTYSNPMMNIVACNEYCTYGGYAYAALGYGNTCECGNTWSGATSVQCDSSCNTPCAGNNTQACGSSTGSLHSVYSINCGTTTFTPYPEFQDTNSSTPNWAYAGCYADPVNPRGLGAASWVYQSTMTIEACISFCSGYLYAGLENSWECWCGNSLATGAVAECGNLHCNQACKEPVERQHRHDLDDDDYGYVDQHHDDFGGGDESFGFEFLS